MHFKILITQQACMHFKIFIACISRFSSHTGMYALNASLLAGDICLYCVCVSLYVLCVCMCVQMCALLKPQESALRHSKLTCPCKHTGVQEHVMDEFWADLGLISIQVSIRQEMLVGLSVKACLLFISTSLQAPLCSRACATCEHQPARVSMRTRVNVSLQAPLS